MDYRLIFHTFFKISPWCYLLLNSELPLQKCCSSCIFFLESDTGEFILDIFKYSTTEKVSWCNTITYTQWGVIVSKFFSKYMPLFTWRWIIEINYKLRINYIDFKLCLLVLSPCMKEFLVCVEVRVKHQIP